MAANKKMKKLFMSTFRKMKVSNLFPNFYDSGSDPNVLDKANWKAKDHLVTNLQTS